MSQQQAASQWPVVDPATARVVFCGTPAFAAASLAALIEAQYRVVAVYTQPDRPAGRGRRVAVSEVKQAALAAAIPVYQPVSLRRREAQAELAGLAPDLLVVAAYGLILPQVVLDIPARGCVNVHASLLPRWRGAAPIQRALLAGDDESGISIMLMEAGLDTGPVLATAPLPIAPAMTGGELHDALATLGGEALVKTLPGWLRGDIAPLPQEHALACYAPKLVKAEAEIDWQQSALVIDRQVRAFNPWPVAQTRLGGEVLRIWRAEPVVESVASPLGPPGVVLSEDRAGPVVATGAGALRLTMLQLAGRRPQAAADFYNARRLLNERLGGA